MESSRSGGLLAIAHKNWKAIQNTGKSTALDSCFVKWGKTTLSLGGSSYPGHSSAYIPPTRCSEEALMDKRRRMHAGQSGCVLVAANGPPQSLHLRS